MKMKTSPLNAIVIVLIPLTVLGAGVFIAWMKYIAPAIGMVSNDVSDTRPGPMLTLEPFIVNPHTPS